MKYTDAEDKAALSKLHRDLCKITTPVAQLEGLGDTELTGRRWVTVEARIVVEMPIECSGLHGGETLRGLYRRAERALKDQIHWRCPEGWHDAEYRVEAELS